MNKNTDARVIVISREMFNKIMPELESSDPDLASSLVKHTSKFNAHFRRELEQKEREKEKLAKAEAERVKAFLDEHRGKKVWLPDSFLPRVTFDYDFVRKLVPTDEEAQAIADHSIEPITIPVKVITKAPGGLGILVEFPKRAKGHRPVRVTVYLNQISMEQPEGHVLATDKEMETQELFFAQLESIPPELKARSMREGLEDQLRDGPEEFVNYTGRITVTQS